MRRGPGASSGDRARAAAYLPVLLDLSGRKCIVVGGGKVGERRVRTLIGAGAAVVVISPRLTAGLKGLARRNAIIHLRRGFRTEDLRGAAIVFSTAGNGKTDGIIRSAARAARVPANFADDPERCDFIMPSIVRRGDLILAVSTGGRSPSLAARIGDELARRYPAEYAPFVDLLGAVRKKALREQTMGEQARRTLFSRLAASPLPEWIRRRAHARIDAYLKRIAGPGYSLRSLGVALP